MTNLTSVESTYEALDRLAVIRRDLFDPTTSNKTEGKFLTNNDALATQFDRIFNVTPHSQSGNVCQVPNCAVDEVNGLLEDVLATVTSGSMEYDEVMVCKMIWFALLAESSEEYFRENGYVKFNSLVATGVF